MSGITVGVDASEHSDRALEWAIQEGAARQQPVTVIAVHEVATNQWTGNPLVKEGDRAEEDTIRRDVEERAAKIAGRLGDAIPPELTVEVVSGVASRVLIDASERSDLIVVGSRGGGGFSRMLLGSVSGHVVQHAACTVTVVR